ncbi:MAG: alpha/beta fold hydrolase [Pirellulales bacterium]|nr:alpha/beta fold hydrolase [Pirellulales bacterium]
MNDFAWRRLYPFADQELRVGGWRYHYFDEGSGEPLLCVHGNPTWSFYWRRLPRAFGERYRVVAPDHLGCGLSDKPAEFSYTLAGHIDNLVELVERLDLRQVTLVAHDWGGAIGMGAALRLPERFSRFVLMNTAAFRAPWMPWRIRACRAPVLGTLAIRGMNAFARAALHMATERGLDADIRAGLIAPYGNWRERIAIDRFVKDIPMTPAHQSYATLMKIEQGLARFRNHPMLLVWGMKDWCFSPHFLRRFQEFFPAAETLEIADAGHYVMEDSHETILPALVDFLERHPVTADSTCASTGEASGA